mmetsp:Transcript_9227/g.17634  ORF Transcript_9227/g.17634 Transcript_9227/m.17634 type:complete len:208 (+) Transcript_9227:53-676(+)
MQSMSLLLEESKELFLIQSLFVRLQFFQQFILLSLSSFGSFLFCLDLLCRQSLFLLVLVGTFKDQTHRARTHSNSRQHACQTDPTARPHFISKRSTAHGYNVTFLYLSGTSGISLGGHRLHINVASWVLIENQTQRTGEFNDGIFVSGISGCSGPLHKVLIVFLLGHLQSRRRRRRQSSSRRKAWREGGHSGELSEDRQNGKCSHGF